ncbi:hypothetical protein ACFC26_07775 [Kitasatospora purpeofusca]|uniref:hypothetical protein n=1 Tax=Kitasatospora purpeofusca TaxID=67352 RepID=UPI0035DE707F
MPTITPEQIQAAQSGSGDAMWEIIDAYGGMITSIVRSGVHGATRDMWDDLTQEARAALITCVQSYSTAPDDAARFSPYRQMLSAVTREVIRSRPGVSVPADLEREIRAALARRSDDLDAAFADVAGHVGSRHQVSRGTFDAAVEALAPVDWLHRPVGGDDAGGLTLADVLQDRDTDEMSRAEARDLVERVLVTINPRRALVLRATYGVGMPPMEDREIAAHLGNVTTDRVRRLRYDGIREARLLLGVRPKPDAMSEAA